MSAFRGLSLSKNYPNAPVYGKIGTACDRKGFVVGVEVTAGNIHDSVAWDKLYEQITERFPQIEFVTMDAGYKTPWIAKRTLDDDIIPILPYTNHHYKDGQYRPWEYEYDPAVRKKLPLRTKSTGISRSITATLR